MDREDVESGYEAGVQAERLGWIETGICEYLLACASGSMSRNNQEQMASEILALLYSAGRGR